MFDNNGKIPSKYTCDGTEISPPLTIDDIPTETISLVLIMDDPDASVGVWDHWIVFNVPPETEEIEEGTEPQGTPGKNSWGKAGYGAPCPADGEHGYVFTVYALDVKLELQEGATKQQILDSMDSHIIEEAQLIGKYERQ